MDNQVPCGMNLQGLFCKWKRFVSFIAGRNQGFGNRVFHPMFRRLSYRPSKRFSYTRLSHSKFLQAVNIQASILYPRVYP